MNENDSDLNHPQFKNPDKTALLGSSVDSGVGRWVQVDRKAHEEWGKLALQHPRASALLHFLVARMAAQNAVVISHKLLAKIMGCSVSTVKRSIADLTDNNWIQVVRVGSCGTVCAYVINDRVAWGQKRSLIPHISTFSAVVITSSEEQTNETLENASKLHKLPMIFSNELQLPVGEPAEPPVQEQLIPNNMPAQIREN